MASSGEPERRHVLVGVTGSVAAIKVPELVERLQKLHEPQAREYIIIIISRDLMFV